MMDQSQRVSIQTLYLELCSLTVFRSVAEQPALRTLSAMMQARIRLESDTFCRRWGELCSLLLERRQGLDEAIAEDIAADDNAFARQALSCYPSPPDSSLSDWAARDLAILYRAATLDVQALLVHGWDDDLPVLPTLDISSAPPPFDTPWGQETLPALLQLYTQRGIGCFSRYRAFLWKHGALVPVENPDPIRLRDLKDYALQKQCAIDNTEAFLDGLESNNILLYGDRGTGKSSTVKALLNEYVHRGLRLIEVSKDELISLPALTALLKSIPMKFLLFIDDLSFPDGDEQFSALKAILEGGITARPRNVLLYATTNRRHLVRETFSAREGSEIHRADTIQEAVSLSDRFGIFLTYLMPDKQRFLDMVAQMADDAGLIENRSSLLMAAERWANERGGRSPRYARQFISDAIAKQARSRLL